MKNLSDRANKYRYFNKYGYFYISGTDRQMVISQVLIPPDGPAV